MDVLKGSHHQSVYSSEDRSHMDPPLELPGSTLGGSRFTKVVALEAQLNRHFDSKLAVTDGGALDHMMQPDHLHALLSSICV